MCAYYDPKGEYNWQRPLHKLQLLLHQLQLSLWHLRLLLCNLQLSLLKLQLLLHQLQLSLWNLQLSVCKLQLSLHHFQLSLWNYQLYCASCSCQCATMSTTTTNSLQASERYRLEGNRLYAERRYEDAVEQYDMAIILWWVRWSDSAPTKRFSSRVGTFAHSSLPVLLSYPLPSAPSLPSFSFLLNSPFVHDVYGSRAIAHFQMGRFRAAVSDGYRCIVLNPDGWKVHNTSLFCYYYAITTSIAQ